MFIQVGFARCESDTLSPRVPPSEDDKSAKPTAARFGNSRDVFAMDI